ncbi:MULTISPECIES: adenylosuccinate lyase [unclassified Carboxydocella]|uniref:adenylosuccinate lyase n=1 Tax=unclassified Carboxydocella TaxID=2685367 RepID=UPI0009AD3A1D|nr:MULTISPECIES: adenylosuccinate lyase [unclassified Carboxydocella]GAW27520.1 adenylosuccinate lyase [Carboxydocella sp. ULO1]GAW32376.1 adenylosuccinate lyase [Carboxydocella sp. JDF658]
MIARYTTPEMKQLWAPEMEFQKWLEVELAACEAMVELGQVPAAAWEVIKARAGFKLERIYEIEKETQHDLIAFLQAVSEEIGEEAKYLHLGMTSSDVKDTALSLQIREALDLILTELAKLEEVLVRRAREHKYTLMIGRTHGIHGEPTTFGLKLALWLAEVRRHQERLQEARRRISVAKLSGAVGTFANIDPRVEELVAAKLGLTPAQVATQVIQRDRHGEVLNALALLASSLDKFATEIRNLQRTDILEVEEYFAKGQKGSSAMPHKRNPITCERIAGLARVVRANALAGMENIALWHERDMTHSSVERIIIPDSTTLVHSMLRLFVRVIDNLIVYPENMLRNLNRTFGLIYSQRVLLALIDRGVTRTEAYQWVQRNALAAWNKQQSFAELLLLDEDIRRYLTPAELKELFDHQYHLKNVDYIFGRLGL